MYCGQPALLSRRYRGAAAVPLSLRTSHDPLSLSAFYLPGDADKGSRRVIGSNDKAEGEGINSNAQDSFQCPKSGRASRTMIDGETLAESRRLLNLRKKLELATLPYSARGGMSLVSPCVCWLRVGGGD